MGPDGLKNLPLVRARLANGADPDECLDPEQAPTVLHAAVLNGSPEVVAELAAVTRNPDLTSAQGRTPLWDAVSEGDETSVTVLLDAGADAWRPLVAGRSPGRLALTTPLAPLFEALPGHVPLTAGERAAQADADARADVFRDTEMYELDIAFVRGIDGDEVIRRLEGHPVRGDSGVGPAPYGTDSAMLDPNSTEAARLLGVTAVPGGCVLTTVPGSLPLGGTILDALSVGTIAYGLHLSGTKTDSGLLSRDGRAEDDSAFGGELSYAYDTSPDAQWLYRFWQQHRPYGLRNAYLVAYAAAVAGLCVSDPRAVAGPPHRWFRLPAGGPLSCAPAPVDLRASPYPSPRRPPW